MVNPVDKEDEIPWVESRGTPEDGNELPTFSAGNLDQLWLLGYWHEMFPITVAGLLALHV